MSRRYLFGPVTADYAAEYLAEPRRSGACLTFNSSGSADLTIRSTDSWESVREQFPADWQPDFIVLHPQYATIPPCLWSATVPLVGLALDWNLLWHAYRRRLRSCELILTDTQGVETCRREGLTHAHAANLYGCGRTWLENPPPPGPRDVDVLFVGNLSAAVQRERLPWLARLARLAERRRVVIRTGVFGEAYRRLLARARIVFNRSIRGECNLRVFEAVAAGALLFQEAENREVPAYLRDRQECVYYDSDNLESLLEHYLDHEDERRALAEAARARLPEFRFETLWQKILDEVVKPELRQMTERARQRTPPSGPDALQARTWEALTSIDEIDTTLVPDLTAALDGEPRTAVLHNDLAFLSVRLRRGDGPMTAALAEEAAGHFRRAIAVDPHSAVAALNLVEALVSLRQDAAAIELAGQALQTLETPDQLDATVWDSPHYPLSYDFFRVEWERAAWSHAGDSAAEIAAKCDLLRWRLHFLLAELTGELAHYEEAIRVRPDLPVVEAAYGCALGRAGRIEEAVPHLRRAVEANPFDRDAARAWFDALVRLGDREGQCRLSDERRRLAQVIPQLVPLEDWMLAKPAGPRPAAGERAQAAGFAALPQAEFERRFGALDTSRAIHSFTQPQDTNVVLTLLAHARPQRVLEIGTALGHMTANFTEWSPDDALVFTLGTVHDLPPSAPRQQQYENPGRADFGRFANHFGKVHKVLFITADSLHYDFRRLATLDFAFIDGAHDREHVTSDTLKVYQALRPGGWLVWHDFGSKVPWVEVQQALEGIRFAEPIQHVSGSEVAFLQKSLTPVPAPVISAPGVAAPAASTRPARELGGIVWEGPQLEVQSLAFVNREICLKLIERGHDLSISSAASHPAIPRLPGTQALAGRFQRPPASPVSVHVRHQWPPNFTPPPEGHWVLMQPWEFGSLPRSWLEPMSQSIDAVWVYTRWLRDCYVKSGVPADRVHVVPLGIDPARFRPGLPALPLQTGKRFKFLFVGGTIHRKGIDLLLQAYTQAFTAEDGVCLVIKDMGTGTFYQGQTAEQVVAQLQQNPQAPAIEYLDRSLSDDELVQLYAACDCLVHPYRGEGFGLPIAEAMACGLPVIVTGSGAALDYCSAETAYLVPAGAARFPDKRVGDLETVDYPWLAEPDVQALKDLMRRVVEHPDEARAKGEAASRFIRSRFTWDQTAEAIERRLAALRQQPVRRFQQAVQPDIQLTVAAGVRSGPARVSLCMIVKNEEENLPECLQSIADLVDEVIVIDTGSSDRTREVAVQAGARVFDFPWVDSFAAARNESLRHASGDWIFWMDADDRIDETNRGKLKALFRELPEENVVFSMKCLCLPDPTQSSATVVDHIRLFRNHPGIRWKYRVHEQILPAVRRLGGRVRFADVVIRHTGYQDPALRGRKLERDLRLLLLEDQENPDDPFNLFNLGCVYQEQDKTAEALRCLRRSLERSHPSDSIVRKLYALIAQCHRRLGQTGEATAACREGRRHYPDDAELLFQEALACREQGDRQAAEKCLLDLLNGRDGEHFASVDTGLRGYKARHNLAVVYREQGRLAEAEAQWQATLAEQPSYLPAWVGLGDVYVLQGRWADLEILIQHLEPLPQGPSEAAVLRARAHLARREFTTARQLLEEVIAHSPEALHPRRILSHVLLQEGRDWAAAEQALRDLLALVPDDSEVKNNLTVLLRQQGRGG